MQICDVIMMDFYPTMHQLAQRIRFKVDIIQRREMIGWKPKGSVYKKMFEGTWKPINQCKQVYFYQKQSCEIIIHYLTINKAIIGD